MRVLPGRLASLAIAGFLAVACFDIVTGLEHWPFGSYPMYSLRYTDRLSRLRLYGVVDRGEIPLRGERDFPPFDEARLSMALERLQAARERNRKIDAALRNLIGLYNGRQSGRGLARQPLRALRLYAVRWVLRPGVEASAAPQERVLVAQVTADEGAP
jgi:hypothetical protein